ncbi:MAG: ribonuclease BN [Nocardioides sp.]|nr:ribonuclease BN [Nocardioides sp.]
MDRTQRRHSLLGFPLAVVYKFFDDQGNVLAAAMTYYAFVAIFPLLLLASSILGFVLQGDAGLQVAVLNSALGQFPIVGQELGRPDGLQGSTGAVIAGALAALYGATGLGQSIQNLVATAWSIPRNSRTNPFLARAKSLFLLLFAGVSVIALSVASALGGSTEVFAGVLGGELNSTFRWLIRVATVVVIGLVLTFLLRFAAARAHSMSRAAPGAFTIALLWQALQYLGTIYAQNVIAGAGALNQTFGFVLGLIGIIYIAAVMAVMGVEVNVVLARRLWPRALLTPFTDSVDLTEADRRAYAMYAQAQRHKGFETVSVRFDGRDGHTHEIVLDPDTWGTDVRGADSPVGGLPDPAPDRAPDPGPPAGRDDTAAPRADG